MFGVAFGVVTLLLVSIVLAAASVLGIRWAKACSNRSGIAATAWLTVFGWAQS
jgi:hypothetical protein